MLVALATENLERHQFWRTDICHNGLLGKSTRGQGVSLTEPKVERLQAKTPAARLPDLTGNESVGKTERAACSGPNKSEEEILFCNRNRLVEAAMKKNAWVASSLTNETATARNNQAQNS
jgi:hypothetical protein